MPSSHRRPFVGVLLGTSADYSWHNTPTGRPEPDGRRAISVIALGALLVGAGGYFVVHHTHPWHLIPASAATGVGLLVWTSYLAWIFRYTLNNERWSRTAIRQVARWVLVNAWWVIFGAAALFGLADGMLGLFD